MNGVKDVSPGLLKSIKESFDKEFSGNKRITELYKKIQAGTATYAEAQDFANEIGKILASAFQNNLSDDVLPNGKMYYNIAKSVVEPMMVNNYILATDFATKVQEHLNKAANIGIKAIKPPVNQDRIDGIINSLTTAEKYSEKEWLLGRNMINFSQSAVDDVIRVNADFHSKSGLSPKIIRKMPGKGCAWCAALVGTYEYPNVPEKVWQRHPDCQCVVEYVPGDGKRQNVHTKKWRNETEIEKRKANEVAIEKELEASRFKRTFNAVPENKVVNAMRADSEKWIKNLTDEEVRCIQKYTLNDVVESPKFYQRLNAMLRGELDENVVLRYYAGSISEALKKSVIGENIRAFRGVEAHPLQNASVGDVVRLKQFLSSSVKANRAFNKNIKMIIYVKKGTKGVAYVENISKLPKQREVLFDKDCMYRVLSNSEELIELEVI